MIRKNKQYFIYYLKDNILIFDVFDYIEELGADYIDYCFEWNLAKENLVSEKRNNIKEYINLYMTDALIKINDTLNKTNCSILCYYKPKIELNYWSQFIKNPNIFISVAEMVFKKRLPNFIKIEEKNLFTNIKGTFNGFPCLIPSGEDIEFLTKIKKKL
jgi:hypothetical protein